MAVRLAETIKNRYDFFAFIGMHFVLADI